VFSVLCRQFLEREESWMNDKTFRLEIDSEPSRSLDVAFFPAAENLSNQPRAIVLSCGNAAVCTGESCKRVKAQNER
jgi:hypothetical protein